MAGTVRNNEDILVPVRGPTGNYSLVMTLVGTKRIDAATLEVLVDGVSVGTLAVPQTAATELASTPLALSLPGGFSVIRVRALEGVANIRDFSVTR